MFRLGDGGDLITAFPTLGHLSQQQYAGSYSVLKGAVYVYDIAQFLRYRCHIPAGTIDFEMNPEQSIEIDTEQNFL